MFRSRSERVIIFKICCCWGVLLAIRIVSCMFANVNFQAVIGSRVLLVLKQTYIVCTCNSAQVHYMTPIYTLALTAGLVYNW